VFKSSTNLTRRETYIYVCYIKINKMGPWCGAVGAGIHTILESSIRCVGRSHSTKTLLFAHSLSSKILFPKHRKIFELPRYLLHNLSLAGFLNTLFVFWEKKRQRRQEFCSITREEGILNKGNRSRLIRGVYRVCIGEERASFFYY